MGSPGVGDFMIRINTISKEPTIFGRVKVKVLKKLADGPTKGIKDLYVHVPYANMFIWRQMRQYLVACSSGNEKIFWENSTSKFLMFLTS